MKILCAVAGLIAFGILAVICYLIYVLQEKGWEDENLPYTDHWGKSTDEAAAEDARRILALTPRQRKKYKLDKAWAKLQEDAQCK